VGDHAHDDDPVRVGEVLDLTGDGRLLEGLEITTDKEIGIKINAPSD
jgi:hypothetical protein